MEPSEDKLTRQTARVCFPWSFCFYPHQREGAITDDTKDSTQAWLREPISLFGVIHEHKKGVRQSMSSYITPKVLLPALTFYMSLRKEGAPESPTTPRGNVSRPHFMRALMLTITGTQLKRTLIRTREIAQQFRVLAVSEALSSVPSTHL